MRILSWGYFVRVLFFTFFNFFCTAAIFLLTNQIALVIVYSTLDKEGPERATRPRDGGEEREGKT